jgi:hypothetical protein
VPQPSTPEARVIVAPARRGSLGIVKNPDPCCGRDDEYRGLDIDFGTGFIRASG